MQPGLPATVPALFGSPTWFGRWKVPPLYEKNTPEPSPLSTTNRGNPDVALSIRSTCQFPKIAFVAPFQLLPKCLPLPNGRSYKTLAVKLSLRFNCDKPQSSFELPGRG